jgi:hypothetical protein
MFKIQTMNQAPLHFNHYFLNFPRSLARGKLTELYRDSHGVHAFSSSDIQFKIPSKLDTKYSRIRPTHIELTEFS